MDSKLTLTDIEKLYQIARKAQNCLALYIRTVDYANHPIIGICGTAGEESLQLATRSMRKWSEVKED